MKNLILYFSLLLSPLFLFSQDTLEVDPADMPPVMPSVLAELFPGQGVEIIDWSFVGAEAGGGVFTGGEDVIGIDHGIILASGNTSTAAEVNLSSSDGINLGQPGDADLNSISTAATQDATSLTVVFKPISDSLHFRYAFASDEYIEYVGSTYNDLFGFFVSGPGINGPFSNNAVNIALIPGTSDVVSINTVNHLQNSQFFTENPHTQSPPPQPVYDGFTDVFSATLPVVPLETYTLKIVIADAGDGIYDSAVFLEAESFGSGNDSLVASVSNRLYNPCLEGEAPAPLTFDLSDFGPWTFPFTSSVYGTAERGVDFEITGLPQSISQSEAFLELELEVFSDAELEGIEQFTIEFESQGGFTFPYHFFHNAVIAPPLNNAVFCDETQPVTLSVAGPMAGQTHEFLNENSAALAPVGEVFTAEIEVTDVPVSILTNASLIESVCLNIDHNWLADLDLFLTAPGGQMLKLSTDNGDECNNYSNTCFSPSANERIDQVPLGSCASSGGAPFSGSFLPESDWDELEGTPVNGTWKLIIVDDNNGFAGTFQNWDITFNTELIFGQPTFEWSTGETTESIEVMPTSTATYSVTVTQSGQSLEQEATIFTNGENTTSEIASTHCENENFSISVNGTIYDMDNPEGTEVFPGGSFFGCDSTVNVNLNFLENSTSEIASIHCENENFSISVNGTIYDMGNPTGTEVFPGGSFFGCDSTANVNLSFFTNDTTVLFFETCEDDCIEVGGETLCGEGQYEIILTGSSGCDSVLIVNISEIPALAIASIEFETSCDYLTYTVTFEIIGGDPATYAVMPFGSGTLAGNVFTSNPISCLNDFLFIVSDGSGCEDLEVPIVGEFCECISNAGDLDETPIGVCFGGEFTVLYDTLNEMYDCNDVTTFLLHEGNFLMPIAISASPTFGTLGLNPGEYFVTVIVGNDGGMGVVDFNDPCWDFSNDVPVSIKNAPTASFSSGTYFYCENGAVELEITLTGEAPWELYFEADGSPLPPVSGITASPFHYIFEPGTWENFSLVGVADAQCQGTAEGIAELEMNPAPTATLTADESYCEGEIATIQLELTGTSPFEVSLSINGVALFLEELPTSSPIEVIILENTQITILEVTDANGCQVSLNESITIEALPSPSPTITADSPVCPNTPDAIQIEFAGEAPYYVAFTLNGALFFDSVPGNLFEFGSIISEDTEFQVVSAVGANGCSSGGSEVVNVEVIPPPEGEASFNAPLCPGFDLVLSASGGVEYDWSGPGGFASEEQMPTLENITENQAGGYIVFVRNECGDPDLVSVEVTFDCAVFEDTVLIGETGEICFDEIITSADLCDPATAIEVSVDDNCLSFTGLEEGVETICLIVVLDGQEVAVNVEVTSLLNTSVFETEDGGRLTVFPNPASESVQVFWEKINVQSAELFDLTGRRLGVLPLANNPEKVPLGHLPEGTYLLRFQTSEGVKVARVVVVR